MEKNKKIIFGVLAIVLLISLLVLIVPKAVTAINAAEIAKEIDNEKKLIRTCATNCIAENNNQIIIASQLSEKMNQYIRNDKVDIKTDGNIIIITYNKSGREYKIYNNSSDVMRRQDNYIRC